MFQKKLGITSSAIGNHEYDMQQNINTILPQISYNLLASNIRINPEVHGFIKLKPSTIQTINGHKYGIIGTSPIDLYKRSKEGSLQKEITVDKAKELLKIYKQK